MSESRTSGVYHVASLDRTPTRDCPSSNMYSLETLDDFVADVLSSLRHRPLHIVLDTRLSLSPNKDILCDSWDSLLRNPSWTWSFGLYTYDPYNRLASSVLRPCALEWYWGGLNHVYDSNCLATTCDRELVEEVHFSEMMQDLLRNTLPNVKSGNLELHTFICGTPRLKRLSLVGHELSTKLLQHITDFQELEQLRVYSPYRKSFHFGCPEDGEVKSTAAVAQMPWFRLPKLTSLDIRFICTHIPVAHLVPPNLKHLAVEYYDRNARFSPSDLEYIASTSPGLEILEMDSIDLRDYEEWTADSLSLPDEHHLLKPLRLFKNLKTLKLIPSYWYDNHLVPRPVLSIDWTVLFFRRVRSLCLSLRTLVICISFGECPHGSIHNMSTRLRPVKFILKDQFGDRVLLRYGISGTKKLHERLYWADRRVEKLGTVLEHRRAYFDDLSEGWILPHMQVPDWGESNDVSDED